MTEREKPPCVLLRNSCKVHQLRAPPAPWGSAAASSMIWAAPRLFSVPRLQQDLRDPKALHEKSPFPPSDHQGISLLYWLLKVPSSQQLKNPKHSSARKINPHIWKEQPFERAPGTLPFDKWGQARPLLLIFSPFEAQGFGIWGLHCTRQAYTSLLFIWTRSKGTSHISKPLFAIFQRFLLWFLHFKHLDSMTVLPDERLLFW